MRDRRRRSTKPSSPIAPADPVEVTITALGSLGDGLAEDAGRRLYVPMAAVGDRLRVRPGARRGDGLEAEIEDILAPGPDRVDPPCPRFGDCGGCALQHLSDPARAAWTRDRVVEALVRMGLGAVPVAPTIAIQPGDRRRAVFVAERHGRTVTIGLNARRSHRIVAPEGCRVLDPALLAVLAPLAEILAHVMADGSRVDVAATRLDDGVDLVIIGRLPPLDLAARERVASFVEAADIARVSLKAGPTAPAEPVVHRRTGILSMGGVPVSPPPGGFLQATPTGEATLRRLVAEGIGTARRIADLFAGSGTFALPLATGATVHAVEGDAASVAALRAAAARVPQMTVERRDLDRSPLPARDLARFDAIVFDPPRAGADAQSREIAASAVPCVVGVSCNPVTFARDARTLVDGGYRLTGVVPVDQFLWSTHVELVGTFVR